MNLKSLAGLADYWSRDHRKFYPWGFAMNGQTSRLEATRQIIHALDIEQIVETGTFRGTTTEWFAQFGIPVETVEAHPRYYSFAKARLRRYENVRIYFESSVSFLKNRIRRTKKNEIAGLFYLDAHWEHYLPLREELELIFGYYKNAVVLIDDFNVHDDPGYGFDNYGPDKTLNFEHLKECKMPPLFAFYPSTPSQEETGMKRGWTVITINADMALKLRSIVLLRSVRDHSGTSEQAAKAAPAA
jgi:hypothetical protein